MFRGKLLFACWRTSSFVARSSESAPSRELFLKSISSSSCISSNNAQDVQESMIPREGGSLTARDEEVRYRQFALLLCFHGVNYYGMQFNVHGPSIENKLFEAFVQAGYYTMLEVTKSRRLIHYNSASRTDRYVSALRQVVSLRLPMHASIQRINEFLPPDIRVLGMKRTTNNFNAQKQCDSRSYRYILPTFAFCDQHKLNKPYNNYRIDADTLYKANEVFQKFKGAHKFHNYTENRDHWDQRSVRKILDLHVSNAYLMEDMEFVELHVTGESFMLHQIRRMIGMTIAIMRGKIFFSGLQDSFDKPLMPTPSAPALGLMLAGQHFGRYNNRFGNIREPLIWNECDNEVENFKNRYIIPHILATEQKEKNMEMFLQERLRRHSFREPQSSKRVTKLKEWNADDSSIDEAEVHESITSEEFGRVK